MEVYTSNKYITQSEYSGATGDTEMSSETFDRLSTKASRLLDTITFDRIPLLPKVPEEVKQVMVEYIEILKSNTEAATNGTMLSSYSNGVEAMTYKTDISAEFYRSLYNVARIYLPIELLSRSVSFDFEEYI